MDKQKAIEVIHNLGGCDAFDEWSKGYDAGITAALEAIEEIPDTADVKRGKWSNYQVLIDDGFGGKRVGYICSACKQFVPNKGNFCLNCGADMRGDT